MKKIAIVIPVYKTGLTHSEQVSLNHLKCYGSKYDCILVCPEELCFDYETSAFQQRPLPKHHFANIDSYNSLCLSPSFYQLFSSYQYILIYQLDAYLFKDELTTWCEQGYSYVGAPWLKVTRWSRLMINVYKYLLRKPYQPTYHFSGTGNGGLSLRQIRPTVDMLTSNRLNWRLLFSLHNPFNRTEGRKWRLPFWWTITQVLRCRLQTHSTLHPNDTCLAQQMIKKFRGPEDAFFHLYGSMLNKQFTLAPPERANLFAFDRGNVDLKMKFNDQILPLGAHACFYNAEIETQYRKYVNFIE